MTRRRRHGGMYRGYNIRQNDNVVSPNDPRVFYIVRVFRCTSPSCNTEWETAASGSENGQDCLCGVTGIQASEIIESTTPIVGDGSKFFGNYKCHQCNRYWCSAHTWANKYQECHNCNIHIYAFGMTALSVRNVGNIRVRHSTASCQKCLEIGGDCSKVPKQRGRRRYRGRQRRDPPNRQNLENNLVGQMQNLNL